MGTKKIIKKIWGLKVENHIKEWIKNIFNPKIFKGPKLKEIFYRD
jgi:hypothetical protein